MTSIQNKDVDTGEQTHLIPPPESVSKARSRTTLFMVGIFSVGVIFGRVATFASSPLWLDYQKYISTRNETMLNHDQDYLNGVGHSVNKTFGNSIILYFGSGAAQRDVRIGVNNGSQSSQNTHKTRIISSYYIVLIQYAICTAVFGLALLGTIYLAPDKITERERRYPKWHFFIIGLSMALSSLLVNSATSGSKTAPYLQALLMDFYVPTTFFIRFLILRKRPTLRKMICAAVLVITEFVCMIPTLFPGLQSKAARQTDGGAEGAARFIWPFIFVLSQVPYAIQSTIIEKITQEKTSEISSKHSPGKSTSASTDQINMIFFLFWTNAFTFISALLLFWTQLIPHFSDVTSLQELGTQLWFNMQCEFAGSTCSGYVTLVSSINIIAHLLAVFSITNLLRWSEGANYMAVILTIRTPILFLLWTLFQEQPFHWFPHASLSTWLSIGAIFVILPTVYAYNTGHVWAYICHLPHFGTNGGHFHCTRCAIIRVRKSHMLIHTRQCVQDNTIPTKAIVPASTATRRKSEPQKAEKEKIFKKQSR